MPEDPAPKAPPSMASLTGQIDVICDRFEEAWRAGKRPCLEEYVVEMPEASRDALFEQLLLVELYWRRQAGERPIPDEYGERFPQFPKQVEAAFASGDAAATATRRSCATGALPGSGISGVVLAPQSDRPAQFGDYEILGEIARGGMGVVYKARQRSLKRDVAVKMIPANHLGSPEQIERFHREAELAGRLRHPNIVSVHEVAEYAGQHFFSMDYIEGRSLDELRSEKPLSSLKAAELTKKVAGAIQYAHDHGILHRDLKPSNILVDESDEPHVMDFGLAKQMQLDSDLTTEKAILGTPAYMAPEQALGEHDRVGPATDVYGLGATLYALLTGRPPFQADNVATTLSQVISIEPVAPRRLNPAVDRDLETICLKCLEKSPRARFHTAAALAEEVDRYLKGEPLTIRPVGIFGRIWRWYRRTPEAPMRTAGGLTTFIAVLLILWGLAGVVILGLGLHPTPNPGQAIGDILLLMVFFYVPILWIGIRTTNGSVVALWLGALFSVVGVLLTSAGLVGASFDPGTFGDLAVRIPLFTLLLILSLLTFCVYAAAVGARYGRRGPHRQGS